MERNLKSFKFFLFFLFAAEYKEKQKFLESPYLSRVVILSFNPSSAGITFLMEVFSFNF